MPLHFPRHKYLGPGTQDFPQSPVDIDDSIAREHDLDSSFPVDKSEIQTADKKALQSFWNDFSKTGNRQSLVGSTGIGLKYGIESITGPLYPSMNKSNHSIAV